MNVKTLFLLLFLAIHFAVYSQVQIQAQAGHSNSIVSFRVTKNMEWLVTAGADGRLIIWDLRTQLIYRRILATNGRIENLELLNDDKWAVVSGPSNELQYFTVPEGDPLGSVPFSEGAVTDIKLTENEDYFLTATSRNCVYLWNSKTRSLKSTFDQFDSRVSNIEYNQNRHTFFATDLSGTITEWDINSGRQMNTIPFTTPYRTPPHEGIEVLKVLSTRPYLLVATNFRKLSLINYETDSVLWSITTPTRLRNIAVFEDRSEAKFAICGIGRIEIREIETSNIIQNLYTFGSADESELLFLNNGKILGNGNGQRFVQFWNLGKKDLYQDTWRLSAPTCPIDFAMFTNQDSSILVIKGPASEFKKISLATGQITQSAAIKPTSSYVTSSAYSKEGEQLFLGMGNEEIQIYDIETLKQVSSFKISNLPAFRGGKVIKDAIATSLIIDEKEKLLILGLQSGQIIPFSLERLKDEGKVATRADSIGWVRMCADTVNNLLYSIGTETNIKTWKYDGLSVVPRDTFPLPYRPYALSISPNGKFISVTMEGNLAFIFDLESETIIWSSKGDFAVSAIEWTGNDQFLVITLPPNTSENGRLLWFEWRRRAFYELPTFYLVENKSTLLDNGSNLLRGIASWSQDRSMALYSGDNSQVGIYDFDRQQTIATFFLPVTFKYQPIVTIGPMDTTTVYHLFEQPNNDLVIVGSDGHYMSTPHGIQAVGFRYQGRVWPPEQFEPLLNRKDLVLRKLPLGNLEAIEYNESLWNFRKAWGSLPNFTWEANKRPSCTIIDKDLMLSTTAYGNMELTIAMHSPVSGLQKLNLWVKGVPIFGLNGKDLKSCHCKVDTITLQVPLDYGLNRIRITVEDEQRNESLAEEMFIQRSSRDAERTLHVVAFGVSDYDDDYSDLPYPAIDVDSIGVVLNQIHSSHPYYRSIRILPLKNDSLRANPEEQVERFLSQASPEDVLLMYINGHGSYNIRDSMFYLVLNGYSDDTSGAGRGISYLQLENMLGAAPPLNKLLIINACRSGNRDQSRNSFGPSPQFSDMLGEFLNIRRTCGASVLTSASGYGVARTDPSLNTSRMSPFLSYFLNRIGPPRAPMPWDMHVIDIIRNMEQKYMDPDFSDENNRPQIRYANLQNDFQIWIYK